MVHRDVSSFTSRDPVYDSQWLKQILEKQPSGTSFDEEKTVSVSSEIDLSSTDIDLSSTDDLAQSSLLSDDSVLDEFPDVWDDVEASSDIIDTEFFASDSEDIDMIDQTSESSCDGSLAGGSSNAKDSSR